MNMLLKLKTARKAKSDHAEWRQGFLAAMERRLFRAGMTDEEAGTKSASFRAGFKYGMTCALAVTIPEPAEYEGEDQYRTAAIVCAGLAVAAIIGLWAMSVLA